MGGTIDYTSGVSIHAPRFREAMRDYTGIGGSRTGFNPRPPFPGGDGRHRRIG